jgi:hypothetical protein
MPDIIMRSRNMLRRLFGSQVAVPDDPAGTEVASFRAAVDSARTQFARRHAPATPAPSETAEPATPTGRVPRPLIQTAIVLLAVALLGTIVVMQLASGRRAAPKAAPATAAPGMTLRSGPSPTSQPSPTPARPVIPVGAALSFDLNGDNPVPTLRAATIYTPTHVLGDKVFVTLPGEGKVWVARGLIADDARLAALPEMPPTSTPAPPPAQPVTGNGGVNNGQEQQYVAPTDPPPCTLDRAVAIVEDTTGMSWSCISTDQAINLRPGGRVVAHTPDEVAAFVARRQAAEDQARQINESIHTTQTQEALDDPTPMAHPRRQ